MKMFNLFTAFCAVMAAGTLLASGDVDYGMFADIPETISTESVSGVRFGLPFAISNGIVDGAELSLCCSASSKVYGFKYTLLGVNAGDVTEGAALAFANFADKELDGVQIGLYNQSASNGIQIGLVNNCADDADFQFGLININKNGWLPFMLFFNLSSEAFK